MTDLRKAAEMALEALEMFCEHGAILRPLETKEALRQALAQPEQEPVAWVLHRELFWPSEYEVISEAGDNAIPLYTAPTKREWVGLTDQEIEDLWNQHESRFDYYSFSCDIEARLKERNGG